MSALRAWLPKGDTLDEKAFAERHLLLRLVLGLHVPALALFATLRGVTPAVAAAAVILPAVCVLAATVFGARRVRAVAVTTGLLWCSAALVHLSGGSVHAHFHFFVVVGLVALYQDWPPFLCAIAFSVLSNGVAGVLGAGTVYDHASGQQRPLLWAALEGAALMAASAAQVLFWQATERAQARAAALATELVVAEEQAARRASVSELFVNLARRNQSLLDRQLALIDDLEQGERDADVLAELFKLDHLATRIRRNAESLLVLSGEEPARRWGAPVALAEVARAALAEIEDYNRADITVDDAVSVSGRAVADLAHLLAELIENAATFSPPTVQVQVKGRRTADGRCLVTIEDRGIGMAPAELAAVNERLAAPPDADVELDRRLGFRVVGRLAARYGMRVGLGATPGGGVTAVVEIPADLVAAPVGGLTEVPPTPVVAAPSPAPARVVASVAAPGARPGSAFAASPSPSPSQAPVAAPAAAAVAPARVVAPVAAPRPAVAPAAAVSAAGPAPEPGPLPSRAPVPPPLPTPATAEATAPTEPGAAAPLPTRTPGASVTPTLAVAPAAPPAAPAATPPAAPGAAAGGAGLPRRTPASAPPPAQPLVPGGVPIRPAGGATGGRTTPPTPRNAEAARLLLSRFQSGQVAGRSAADARRDDLAVSASTVDPTTTPEEER